MSHPRIARETFYSQHLHSWVPKAPNNIAHLTVFLANLEFALAKAAWRTLMKLTPCFCFHFQRFSSILPSVPESLHLLLSTLKFISSNQQHFRFKLDSDSSSTSTEILFHNLFTELYTHHPTRLNNFGGGGLTSMVLKSTKITVIKVD